MYTQRSSRRRLTKALAVPAALALVAAACGDDDDDDGDDPEPPADDNGDGDGDDPDETDPEDEATGDGGEISLAWIAWEENIANTNLWAEILDEEGYDITLEGPFEPGIAFEAVGTASADLFLDVWMPGTHASYMEGVEDDVEELGTWFEGATVELTVPAYLEDIDSLEDLADNADMFNSTITGIEAGAGMMDTLANEVVPAYGLDDWNILESSTPAMRQELQRAYDAEEPIVVTLWTPHPEYVDKDLKVLEDPEGAWGEGEELQGIARDGFSDEFPEVTTWLENFEMTDDEIGELQSYIEEAGEGNEREAARDWIDDNRELVDSWLES